jgi:hypothetical protein
MSQIRNPITHRMIDRDGRTANIPAVRYRLSGRTFEGNKHSGCAGRPVCQGSKLQVWNGTALKTMGGVTRAGLMQKPNGRIVFRSRSQAAKRNPEFMARAKEVKAQFKRR